MIRPDTLPRRRLLFAAAGVMAVAAGCGTSPPVQLHRLPLQAPETPETPERPLTPQTPQTLQTLQTPAIPSRSGPSWELAMRPALPAYLDRDELLVDRGQGRVEALPGQRWAEPLAEAVPRLLLHDLALLRGTSLVWPAPAPPSAGVQRRLRLQVLALQAEPASAVLRLHARWTLEDMTREAAVPQVALVQISVPLAQPGAAGLVQAHRLALWRLAQRIAADGGLEP